MPFKEHFIDEEWILVKWWCLIAISKWKTFHNSHMTKDEPNDWLIDDFVFFSEFPFHFVHLKDFNRFYEVHLATFSSKGRFLCLIAHLGRNILINEFAMKQRDSELFQNTHLKLISTNDWRSIVVCSKQMVTIGQIASSVWIVFYWITKLLPLSKWTVCQWTRELNAAGLRWLEIFIGRFLNAILTRISTITSN